MRKTVTIETREGRKEKRKDVDNQKRGTTTALIVSAN